MKSLLGLVVVLSFSLWLSMSHAALSDNRLYELRVYTVQPGMQSNTLKLIEESGVKFMAAHKIEFLAAWVPADKSDERVFTLVRHANRKECDAAWAAFQADPKWQEAAMASMVEGKKPVKSFDRIFLSANDYSPEFEVKPVGDRVFELRTYVATPKNLSALNDRFRNHTMKLFEKHGMTNIAYWSIADGESLTAKKLLEAVAPIGKADVDVAADLPAAGNSLVYFITHKSQDAAKASFGSFGQDPEWDKVRKASEQAVGGMSLTAKNGVKSLFLVPASFSPLK